MLISLTNWAPKVQIQNLFGWFLQKLTHRKFNLQLPDSLAQTTQICFFHGWSSPKKSNGWFGRTCKARIDVLMVDFWCFVAHDFRKLEKEEKGLPSWLFLCLLPWTFLPGCKMEWNCRLNCELSVGWVWWRKITNACGLVGYFGRLPINFAKKMFSWILEYYIYVLISSYTYL